MRWFRRKSGDSEAVRGYPGRGQNKEDQAHLEQFVNTRRGVEAYVEPRTAVTEMTVVLVAHDGEWTRRRISGADSARKLGQRLSIPVYDVAATGYPQRMRAWTRRRKEAGGPDAPAAGPQLG